MSPIRFAGEILILLGVTQIVALVVAALLVGPVLPVALTLVLLVGYLAIAVACVRIGRGICVYEDWARIAGIVVAVLILFIPPVGTLTGGIILWCLIVTAGRDRVSHNFRIVVVSASTLMVIVAVSAGFSMPEFSRLFYDFSTDLPLITILALKYHSAVLLLPAIFLATWLLTPLSDRPLALLRVGFAGVTLTTLVVTIAVYLPVYMLGSAVS